MKTGIHPQYYEATVKCACGNHFKVGSTLKEINVEICNACHPFYTGKEKVIDTAGRVEKFKRKVAAAATVAPKQKAPRKKKSE